jgi:molybdopterin converting factor small subunit
MSVKVQVPSPLRGLTGGAKEVEADAVDVRFLQQKATPLKPGDTVAIVPAIAGGRT